MSVMERLRERADGGAPVGDLLEEALTEAGYTDALEAERTIEAEGRLENLEELVSVAREYDAQADEPSVEEFLQQIALFSEQDNLTDEEGIVTLMTLHNAKGLEYPVVFMIGMEDGVFPHMRSIEAGDIEEERRLCYVGHDAGDARPLPHARAHARDVRRARVERAQPLPERDPGRADRPGGRRRHRRSPSWSETGAGAGAPAPRRARAPRSTWGRTSCTRRSATASSSAPSRAGVVVVRFRGDGSERKLMADYAPLKKA